jgi:ABC-2 type transport system ATP-binding protein
MIVLDEPTSGLDPVQVVHMRELLGSLKKKHTIVVSSHILSEIHAVCDRIFVLQDGAIVAEGSESELSARVHGAMRVAVEVAGELPALTAALAQAGLAAQKIEQQNGRLRAWVEFEGDRRSDLARALVQADLSLLELSRSRMELEDIFLQLTGGAK